MVSSFYPPKQLLSDLVFLLPSFKCFHLFCVFFPINSVCFVHAARPFRNNIMMCGNALLEMFQFCPWINLEILNLDALVKVRLQCLSTDQMEI